MNRISKKLPGTRYSSYGFTLLEVIISVALLLIVSLFIYQGFMSTIQYSANTSAYEKSAQSAKKDAQFNLALKDPGNKRGLFIEPETGSKIVLSVNSYSFKPNTSLVAGDINYSETSSLPATNRYSYSFIERACPTTGCTGKIFWYEFKDPDTDDITIRQSCTKDCGYDAPKP